MRYEGLPVTPALITWARTRAGLTIEEAGKSFKRIQAWEDGELLPTYPQLEQLADAFKVPVAVFFFPEPPAVPNIGETFRTLPATEFERIPSRMRLLLRKAKALQLNLMELTGGRNTSPRLITRELTFPPAVRLSDMADTVRAYLGLSLEEQRALADDEAALKRWRQALLDAGIYVFKDAFRVDEFSGFCLFDEIFPIIYVNNSAAKTRQIFTLFHELGHLLFHTSGIDTVHGEYVRALTDEPKRIEIVCNRFAAEFLLPERAFNSAVRGQPATEATPRLLPDHFMSVEKLFFADFLRKD